ncbi:MAG: NAD(P)H-dependent oxidoreductase [Spirochaetaceae bacterium]|jgi:multimeric flavodoxin WrbA|nr:NAD(P)H-dependent oxidoreductase [Spirochaetaceae bacterium]
MNIVLINGTEVRGCTYNIKEFFLDELRDGNNIKEFYLPKDCPNFCCGCKTCFFKDENMCPHAEYTVPLWNDIIHADLLVFAYPVYVLRVPGQIKALLDHFGVHWMVHRPKEEMFTKKAVILTQSIGAPNISAQNDVKTSLSWLGISDIKKLGFELMEHVIWEKLSEKRKKKIETKIKKICKRYVISKRAEKSIKHRLLFAICKMLHQKTIKTENPISVDNRYWLDKKWIKQ